MSVRAVVFAYSEVGVRCLPVLLRAGVQVPLVVTHADAPDESRWFASVAELARTRGIEVLVPDSPAAPEVTDRVAQARPDFLFSFYYRQMLPPALLAVAPRGALNLHGSLLPKYRGRAPVNWAILNGETQTGVTLHYMERLPDAGAIVDSETVAILPDETAAEVFRKVTRAAETVLERSLPLLIAGIAPARPQDLGQGSYFGRRTPEDGIIDWQHLSARRVHDLVRAVAPPYPGAWTACDSRLLKITRTRIADGSAPQPLPGHLFAAAEGLLACASDRRFVQILGLEVDGVAAEPADFARALRARHGNEPVRLTRPPTLSRAR